MSEPHTEAGRALHQHLREVHEAGYIGGTTWDRIDRGIAKTEQEAVAQALRRIKIALEFADGAKGWGARTTNSTVKIRSVLAILDADALRHEAGERP